MPDEASVDLMVQGFSCAEAIVMAFADECGLESGLASRIAAGFGFAAGPAQEKTCGAVIGAMIVIGLK